MDGRNAETTDWLLATEKEKYELGKRWLATMMGEDVETFTDEKIVVGIGKEDQAIFYISGYIFIPYAFLRTHVHQSICRLSLHIS